MSVPSSMVHRSGNDLIVRSVVSGDVIPLTTLTSSSSSPPPRPPSSSSAGVVASDPDTALTKELLPDCKVKRNYTCTGCDFFTQNPRVYLYHLRDVHNERVRVYECPSCLYASRHFQKLLRHTKMVHGRTTPPPMPAAASETRKRANNVVVDDEDDDDEMAAAAVAENRQSFFKCSVCDFTSKGQLQLARHEREEHIKTKFFRCSKCTYVTHIKARYTKHVKYHSMPMIKCDMCDFRTPYKWNLDRHCKNHNGNGAFKCSACNFTADIKQSLTVHEMNHHVPPVGQAAGLGVGRRRNKVGASDTTAAEERQAAAQKQNGAAQEYIDDQQAVKVESYPEAVKEDVEKVRESPNKKLKIENNNNNNKNAGGDAKNSDFINPDDIVHHSNGKVYFKTKCKLCNYKTPWDSEMAKHEKKVHNIFNQEEINGKSVSGASANNNNNNNNNKKSASRPIPNLIPIPTQPSVLKMARVPAYPVLKTAIIPEPSEPMMSQKDINDICAKSSNSVLKDLASLFGSEDVFQCPITPKVPDLIPASVYNNSSSSSKLTDVFKQKNASFFDSLREKLELGTATTGTGNLTCKVCGHESKCLTEYAKHQKSCGKNSNRVHNFVPLPNISSSRCQFCRQRCKSSVDLYNHLQSCPDALKAHNISIKEESPADSEPEGELKIDEDHAMEDCETKPHPMENKVFVWNDIVVPMNIEVDDSNYEYTEDKTVDDNVSLDLSIRTQSPIGSENSYFGQDLTTSSSAHPSPLPPATNTATPTPTTTTDKIPTHGNDISIAQHKRVFKCPHCTFWASTASRFHVHIVGHLNKKPFECSLCSYRSNWRWDITKHIKLKSVRDPAHETAKVLMTDETGRRNYTKYNKYLTEIPVSSEQSMDTSGGCGTRPKHHERNGSPSTTTGKSSDLPRLSRAPNSNDFSPLLKSTRPPPPGLKVVGNGADGLMSKISEKKRSNNADGKKTLFKCKKCNFKDASRDILLEHVKGHYQQSDFQQQQQCSLSLGLSPSAGGGGASSSSSSTVGAVVAQDLSLRGTSPDRADERHCRLKHSGDIRVVSNKNGQEKIEIDELTDEPDHIDVIQDGAYKCPDCPYSSDQRAEFEGHISGHEPNPDSVYKCFYCKYFVTRREDITEHLRLHGITDPENFLQKVNEKISDSDGKKFRCVICPYVTNSKSQYTYHKQFHKPRGGQYTCNHCSYNVSKRHLLHQHLKVHGINVTSHRQNGEMISLDEIEEVPLVPVKQETFLDFHDIPLVWVSKNGKFSKMFKCRYCPHVNLRKVNIQEHEKMHSTREKNPNSSRLSDIEHRCGECNYVCNNAGVLSSHSKVHQGLYGTVHRLVDPTKTDEEQIKELSKTLGIVASQENGYAEDYVVDSTSVMETEEIDSSSGSGSVLYFCKDCPARFLKENEFGIHKRFHTSRLFYKCEYCTYTSREKPHLVSHSKVHTTEYQDRTKVLQAMYITSSNYPQPPTHVTRNANGEAIWGVADFKPIQPELSTLCSILNKPIKSQCVPLSGTDLFLQKSEAEQKHAAELIKEESTSPEIIDPELMKGDPSFIYPTTLKNGVMKQKRYKCHKCPSAFEKREQYKVHLGLHGAKQRYKCDHCDYSVKYYANYIQHLKKHKLNADIKARQSSDEMEDEVIEETDQEESQKYRCMLCPFGSSKKEITEKHQKRHFAIGGTRSAYQCDHCDYSDTQSARLKEHVKWHLKWNLNVEKMLRDSKYYMWSDPKSNICIKQLPNSSTEDESSSEDSNVIFEERSSKSGPVYSPPLNADIEQKFNNNEGEKHYVNVLTGEVVDKEENGDMRPEDGRKMEVN